VCSGLGGFPLLGGGAVFRGCFVDRSLVLQPILARAKAWENIRHMVVSVQGPPREVKSEEEKELKVSRAEFVRKIEDLCRERTRS
jgi:hypothetical protein